MAALDQLSGLLNIINSVSGQSQTSTSSGGKQTTQTNLSDAAVQEQIKRILAGPGGVRDIGGSARRSGIYNSTSEDTLLGNLYATAANQGEIARAPTVTTSAPSTTTTKADGVGIGTALGTIGGGALLSSVLNSDAVGNGVDSLLGAIGLGSTGKTGVGSSVSGINGGITGGFGLDNILNGGIGFGGAIGQDNPSGAWSGNSFNGNMNIGLPGVSSGTATGTGTTTSNGEFDLLGSVGSAISGFFSGGGLGGLVGAISGGTGGGASGGGGVSGGSIICTALMNKGLLDKKLYAAGDKYIQTVSPITKVGYYVWARSVAAKIDKGHKGWTKVCLPFARGRTALLASSGSLADHFKYPLGTLTKFVGEPVCHIIGLVVTQPYFLKVFFSTKGA